jgi:hypothetical protein
VRRGITLAVLLRTYRLPPAWFRDVWCEGLTRRVADPPELLVGCPEAASNDHRAADRHEEDEVLPGFLAGKQAALVSDRAVLYEAYIAACSSRPSHQT